MRSARSRARDPVRTTRRARLLPSLPLVSPLTFNPHSYFEAPSRLSLIKDWLVQYTADAPDDENRARFDFVEHAEDYPVERVVGRHEREYVDYLRTAYDEWVKDGGDEVRPTSKRIAED